jgi:hypothetical protein
VLGTGPSLEPEFRKKPDGHHPNAKIFRDWHVDIPGCENGKAFRLDCPSGGLFGDLVVVHGREVRPSNRKFEDETKRQAMTISKVPE